MNSGDVELLRELELLCKTIGSLEAEGKKILEDSDALEENLQFLRKYVTDRVFLVLDPGQTMDTGELKTKAMALYSPLHQQFCGEEGCKALMKRLEDWNTRAKSIEERRVALNAKLSEFAFGQQLSERLDALQELMPKLQALQLNRQDSRTTGEKIIALRWECGWSQDDLADEAGVDVSTVKDCEKKGTRPYKRTLLKLADAFSRNRGRAITVHDLMPTN